MSAPSNETAKIYQQYRPPHQPRPGRTWQRCRNRVRRNVDDDGVPVVGVFGCRSTFPLGVSEIGTADGASGVESEPLVDAVGVEDVVATGEKAKRLLVVVELGDADSALERPLPDLQVHGRRILEGRERRDDGGVEPPGSAAGPEAIAGG